MVAGIGLLAYLIGLTYNPTLFLQTEFIGGFLALMLVGSAQPSADHLLQRVGEAEQTLYGRLDPIHDVAARFNQWFHPYEMYVAPAIRFGLGSNFIYLGVTQKLFNPGQVLVVVHQYHLTVVIPVLPEMWIVGVGLVETSLGLALLLGLFTRGVAALAFSMFTLTLFGLSNDPVLVHVSLFGLTSALFVTGSGPLSINQWIAPQPTPIKTMKRERNQTTEGR